MGMIKIQKYTTKCWQGCETTGTLIHWKWGRKRVQTLWKLVWWFLIKISICLPHDPGIVLLKRAEKSKQKSAHIFYSSFINNFQNLEAIKTSFSR